MAVTLSTYTPEYPIVGISFARFPARITHYSSSTQSPFQGGKSANLAVFVIDPS
jgi:hypothetical protein